MKKFLELVGREGKESGESYMVRCLNPKHDDHRPSLAIAKHSGMFTCYSCGIRGGVWDLLELSGLSEDAIESCFNNEAPIRLRSRVSLLVEMPDGFRTCYHYNGGWATDELLVYPQYLRERGVTKEQIWQYSIGVCEDGYCKHRVVFPVFLEEQLVGWIARTTRGEEPKYLYPRGMRKSSVLFGDGESHKNGRVVVVCEGIMDAFRIENVGFHAAAILGSQVSDTQAMLLRRNSKVIIAPDNDEAGENMVLDAVKKLSGVPVYLAQYKEKDPAECSVETLRKALEGAVRLS